MDAVHEGQAVSNDQFEQEIAALLHEVRALKAEMSDSDASNGRRAFEAISRIQLTTKRQRQVLEASLRTMNSPDTRDRITQKIHVCLMIEHECLLLPETRH